MGVKARGEDGGGMAQLGCAKGSAAGEGLGLLGYASALAHVDLRILEQGRIPDGISQVAMAPRTSSNQLIR